MKRASEPRFRRSEALSHTWWQVKDSNLRSFRDGSTDHRLQTRDQPKRLTRKQLTGVFQADSRRQPTTAVANRTRHRLPSRRLLTDLTDPNPPKPRLRRVYAQITRSIAHHLRKPA